jgi:DnaJ family protein A protein 2
LEVEKTATQEEIKKAYRKLVLTHHPDKGGDAERFKAIQMAYETLSNEEKRKTYDTYGEAGPPAMDASNLFTNLFQNNPMFSMFQQARDGIMKTPATIHQLLVSLEDICQKKECKLKITRERECECIRTSVPTSCIPCKGNGKIVTLKPLAPGFAQQIVENCGECKGSGKRYQTPCTKCSNCVVNDVKVFVIQLSETTENQKQIIFTGEGNQTTGYEPGDLIVVILYEKHPVFTVDGKNLFFTKEISLKEALCGHTVEILHPSGEVLKQEYTEITSADTIRVITGKGLTQEGNLEIKYVVRFPKKLTQEQKTSLAWLE